MVDAALVTLAVAVLWAGGFALVAYALHVLDAGGSLLAASFAMMIVLAPGLEGLDGLRWLGLLVLFVLVAYAVTRLFWPHKQALGLTEGKRGVRGWRNVAANGLVPALLALLTVWLDPAVVAVAFVAAVATASADTFASELGVLSRRTYLITNPRRRVPPGTNGGVSNWGHLVALGGAAAATAAGILLLGIPWHLAWLPTLAGFLGCQIDSLLGALFEEGRGRVAGFMTKSDVNFLSILVASFGVLLVLVV